MCLFSFCVYFEDSSMCSSVPRRRSLSLTIWYQHANLKLWTRPLHVNQRGNLEVQLNWIGMTDYDESCVRSWSLPVAPFFSKHIHYLRLWWLSNQASSHSVPLKAWMAPSFEILDPLEIHRGTRGGPEKNRTAWLQTINTVVDYLVLLHFVILPFCFKARVLLE